MYGVDRHHFSCFGVDGVDVIALAGSKTQGCVPSIYRQPTDTKRLQQNSSSVRRERKAWSLHSARSHTLLAPESSVYVGILNKITSIDYTGHRGGRKSCKKERALLRVCGQLTCEPPTSWSTSLHFRQLDTETRPAVRTAEGTAAMPSWHNLDYL